MNATTSSDYTWGPWIRDPQYEGKENMLPEQFRACAPDQQEVATKWEQYPFSLGSHVLLEKEGGNERVNS